MIPTAFILVSSSSLELPVHRHVMLTIKWNISRWSGGERHRPSRCNDLTILAGEKGVQRPAPPLSGLLLQWESRGMTASRMWSQSFVHETEDTCQ